jgi:hypothetical protein
MGVDAMFLPCAGADISPVPGMLNDVESVAAYGAQLSDTVRLALSDGVSLFPLQSQTAYVDTTLRFDFIPDGVGDDEEMGVALKALEESNPTFMSNDERWRALHRKGELPSTRPFPLRALRLGSLWLVSIPAEVFAETQFDLQERFPDTTILIVSHSGGNIGYLPRPFAYRLRTYETASAYKWYGTDGAASEGEEERVREMCSELLAGS